MKRKLFFFSLLILVAVFTLSANEYEEVVYLKNGSVVRGMVVETIPNESIKIRAKDGSVFFFWMKDVQKIIKEEIVTRNVQKPETREESKKENPALDIPKAGRKGELAYKSSKQFNKPKGYLGLLEFSLSPWNHGEFGFTLINGYRVCPQFAVGGGIGLSMGNFKEVHLPIFLHLRSDFLDQATSPYFALNLGYNVALAISEEAISFDGFFAAPSFGVSYNVGGCRMTTGFEISFAHVTDWSFEVDYDYWGNINEVKFLENKWYVTYNLKLGVSF